MPGKAGLPAPLSSVGRGYNKKRQGRTVPVDRPSPAAVRLFPLGVIICRKTALCNKKRLQENSPQAKYGAYFLTAGTNKTAAAKNASEIIMQTKKGEARLLLLSGIEIFSYSSVDLLVRERISDLHGSRKTFVSLEALALKTAFSLPCHPFTAVKQSDSGQPF